MMGNLETAANRVSNALVGHNATCSCPLSKTMGQNDRVVRSRAYLDRDSASSPEIHPRVSSGPDTTNGVSSKAPTNSRRSGLDVRYAPQIVRALSMLLREIRVSVGKRSLFWCVWSRLRSIASRISSGMLSILASRQNAKTSSADEAMHVDNTTSLHRSERDGQCEVRAEIPLLFCAISHSCHS
jgi:hypothetical protein